MHKIFIHYCNVIIPYFIQIIQTRIPRPNINNILFFLELQIYILLAKFALHNVGSHSRFHGFGHFHLRISTRSCTVLVVI